MDNLLNFRCQDDTDTNIVIQQSVESDEPDSTAAPGVHLNINSFKNDCEGLKSVSDERSVSTSSICEQKNNNDPEDLAMDQLSSLDNEKYSTEIGDHCVKSLQVKSSTNQGGGNSLEAKLAKKTEDSSGNSNIASCSTSCLELAQPTLQLPTLYEKSLINPIPNEFDMIEGSVLPDYSTLLLQSNSCASGILSEPDDSVVISNNNAIPQTETVVASNFSLNLLKSYESDESSDGEACEVSQKYREGNDSEDSDKDSDSDSSSTSSSSSILISDSSDSESDELFENVTAKSCKPIKGRNELDLEDLPPIQDLKISVPEEDCTAIGKVFQIVDRLVVVQSFKDVPAYNMDTVLFVEGGQPLGMIFDVFGPVTEPYYCVRFNSREHIMEKNINIDQMVYSAPNTKYTKYVFLAQLMQLKGSDASWEDDNEPPEGFLEYSDDEQEQRAKKKKSKNRKAVFRVDTDPDEPARKRHSAYEKRMNERNLQLSAFRNHQNASKSKMQGFKSRLWSPVLTTSELTPSSVRPSVFKERCHQTFGRPPTFNRTVPPPDVQFGLSPRPEIPHIQGPRHNVMRTPPPRSINHNNFVRFSQQFPGNRPSTSPRFPDNSIQSYPFPPSQMSGPNNDPTRWAPQFSRCENSWARSHPVRGPVTNNSSLPSSTFWNQRPQYGSNISTPFSALPNSHTLPFCTPPGRFWPTQSPPQSRNMPCNGSSQINFNPNVPPPSPNLYNH